MSYHTRQQLREEQQYKKAKIYFKNSKITFQFLFMRLCEFPLCSSQISRG